MYVTRKSIDKVNKGRLIAFNYQHGFKSFMRVWYLGTSGVNH